MLAAAASAAALVRRRQLRAAAAALLLRHDRQRPPGRLPAQEPRVRGHPARDRRARRGCLLFGADRPRRSWRRCATAPNHAGDITAGRSCRLPRQGARAASASTYRGTASAAWVRRPPAASPWRRSLKLLEPFDLGSQPARRHERPGAAPDRRGREARLCRPRPLSSAIPTSCRRRPVCSMRAISTTRRALIDPGAAMARARRPARCREIGSRTLGDDETVEAARHQPLLHRRSRRQRAGHDHHHRSRRSARACGRRASCSTTSSPTSPSARSTARAGRSPTPWRRASGRAARWRRPSCSTTQGKPWAVLGSPGGSRIILYVVKALVALIDWKLDAQQATALMNFGSRGGPFEIEVDHASAVWHALKVKPYGHRVQRRSAHLRHARHRSIAQGRHARRRRRPAARGRRARRLRFRQHAAAMPSPSSAPASSACGRR